jgi:ubiquitin carboxyl-terminal hydrolase 4/11/15
MGYKKKKATTAKKGTHKAPPNKPDDRPTPADTWEQEAQTHKEAGNAYVQQMEYLKALEAYGKGLACFNNITALQPQHMELQTALYSNRALMYLKLARFEEAEKDCTAALRNPGATQQAKIYYRRALAREGRARQMIVAKTGGGNSVATNGKPDTSTNGTHHSDSSGSMEMTTEPVSLDATSVSAIMSIDKQEDLPKTNGASTFHTNHSEASTTETTTQQQMEQREKQLRYQLATEILILGQNDLQECIQIFESNSQPADAGMKKSIAQLKTRLQKTIHEYRQKAAVGIQHPAPAEQRTTVLLLLTNRRTCLASADHNDSTDIALEGEAFFLLDWEWWYNWCRFVGLVPQKNLPASSSYDIQSLLPAACPLDPREEDSDDDSMDEEDDEHVPPGPIDNSRLILELPEKIGTNTRDAFFADWYKPYKEHVSTVESNDNDKENVIGDESDIVSSLSLSPVLKPNVVRGYHYEAIPREVYSALRTWYGELSSPICRRVVKTPTGSLVLPLYFTPGDLEFLMNGSKGATPDKQNSPDEPSPCSACGACRATSRCQRCLRARYCNRSCQESHWSFHKLECKKQPGYSQAIVYHDGACRVGLNNLGNTCFMNSALQALSHTVPLTRHFLSGAYKPDLNPDNPLGTGGKLADAYAAVLKDMWWNANRKSSTSPSALKRAIALFAPRFAGYIQHDSQEFLAYFLDGLHEDLNRIRKAPYVEMPDVTDGQDMNIAAARAWEAHCRRNDSLVMDTFYGQFKSTCVCPDCNRVSLSFDAFNHVSLEIPQAKNAVIPVSIWVYPAGSGKNPTRYSVDIRRNATLTDLRANLAELSGIAAEKLVICEVMNHVIVERPKIFDPVSDIRSDDFMVAYEVEHAGAVLQIVASHVLVEGADSELADSDVKADPLGIPFLATYPVQSTCKEVHEHIWSKVAHLVSHDNEEKDDQRNLLKIRLHDGRGRSLFLFPSDNEQLSPYVPSDSEEKLVDILGQLASEPYVFLSLDWSTVSPGQIDRDRFAMFNDHPSWVEASRRKLAAPKVGVTLDQCFDAFTTPERLDENNKWYCSNCKEHVQAMKTMELWRLPNVLIVHLKRFEFKNILRRDKLDTFVDFPLASLDMSRHCASQKDSFTHSHVPAIYDLFAVTNHYGRLGAGHYTAFARSWNERTRISDDWCLFDDSSVRPVPNANDAIVTPAAYVLFYRRRIFH